VPSRAEARCPVAMLDKQSSIAKAKPQKTAPKGGSGFGFFDDDKSAQTIGTWPADPGGGASRFFYCAKISSSERNAGLEDRVSRKVNDGRSTAIDNPFQRGETERLNTHPTVKPKKLMGYLINLITPPGGVVLDPFMGSGSTGLAANENAFHFIGIEREKEYFDISKARIGI
jgi:hypothetical protein